MRSSISRETKIFFIILACFCVVGSITLFYHTILTASERDGSEFLLDAKRILNWEGYDSDFWPFGYMAVIAGLGFASGIDLFTCAKTVSFLSALGVFIFTYLIGKELFPKKVSLFAVIVLVTNHLYFMHSIIVETDMLFTCFFMMSVYFLVKRDHLKNYLLAGCMAGLAYMVKYGVYAIFPVVIILAFLKLFEKEKITALTAVLIFLCSFLVSSSPWLINNTLKNGSPFYSKHHVNIAWGMNRPQPMQREYWLTYPELNEKYGSMKDILKEKSKFLKNWARNIWELPNILLRIFPLLGFFVLPAYFMLFRSIDRRKLILILIIFCFLCLITMAYTWDRYLLPIIPILAILIAYITYKILPRKVSSKYLIKGLSVSIPFRAAVMALLILLSTVKTFTATKDFMQSQIPEFKIAGEWLKENMENDEWLMVPEQMLGWYANTENFVKYPRDTSLPLDVVVTLREQSTFLFIQEGLSNKIITDVDYFIYEKRWWKHWYPGLILKNRPVVPKNFMPVFSTTGQKTEVIIYKVIPKDKSIY